MSSFELVCIVNKDKDGRDIYRAQVHFLHKGLFGTKRKRVGLYWSSACLGTDYLMTDLATFSHLDKKEQGEKSYSMLEIEKLFGVFMKELEGGEGMLNGFEEARERFE